MMLMLLVVSDRIGSVSKIFCPLGTLQDPIIVCLSPPKLLIHTHTHKTRSTYTYTTRSTTNFPPLFRPLLQLVTQAGDGI